MRCFISTTSARCRSISARCCSAQGTLALEQYREQDGGADPRFVYNVAVGSTSIASSTGSMDSSVLALTLRDERYLPS
jgi:hypothetical protein